MITIIYKYFKSIPELHEAEGSKFQERDSRSQQKRADGPSGFPGIQYGHDDPGSILSAFEGGPDPSILP